MLSRNQSERRGGEIVGLLDVGTNKIVCLIAELVPAGRNGAGDIKRTRVLGVGHQRSRGLKAGVITDLVEAEAAIRATIAQAERKAQVTLEEVFVSVSCGRLQSLNFSASVDIEGGVVDDHDIERVMAGARSWTEREERMLVHLNRIGFRLDGATDAGDPRGMAARRMTCNLHAVAADEAPIRNLLHVIECCYLSASALVTAPYASALATTSEEERHLGVTCIDMGGGTTTVAVFAQGHFIHAGTVHMGGHHISCDIAQALQTPLAEAERIKTLYGTMLVAQSDEHEEFSYPLAGEDDGAMGRMTKADLAGLIRPRVANMLALARERIEQSGVSAYAGERVVLTGGTSELVGMGEFAADALGRPVRVASPQPIAGMGQSVTSPAFSTVAGLLAVAAAGGEEVKVYRDRNALAPGYLERVGQWLKSGF
jgi:cell division protein FtsA